MPIIKAGIHRDNIYRMMYYLQQLSENPNINGLKIHDGFAWKEKKKHSSSF